jgi:hypothetical protein
MMDEEHKKHKVQAPHILSCKRNQVTAIVLEFPAQYGWEITTFGFTWINVLDQSMECYRVHIYGGGSDSYRNLIAYFSNVLTAN